MSDDEALDSSPEAANAHTLRVGRRLFAIREELGRRTSESEWSQSAVAKKTGLTQNIVWRIEQGEGGKVENWLRLMYLYEAQGYNLNWMLTEHNALVSKIQLDEATSQGQLVEELLRRLAAYEERVGAEIASLRELLLSRPRNVENQ